MPKITLTRPLRSPISYGPPAHHYSSKKQDNKITPPSPLKGEVGGVNCFELSGGKNQVTVEDVLALASKLTEAENKTLLAKLSLAQQTQSTQTRDLDMWSVAVYEAILAAQRGSDGAVQGPMLVKRAVSSHSNWSAVRDFMVASKLLSLSVTERQSIYQLLAKLVVQSARFIARRSGAPLSAKLVASCSVNVASLFDNAFPGYVASGLALMVAQQLIAPK